MKIVDWAKGKLSDYINRGAVVPPEPQPEPTPESEPEPELTPEPEPDDGESPEVPVPVSQRFKVTEAGGRIFYVYGQTKEEALARLPAPILVDAKVEAAGYVENGVCRFPNEELRQVMATMQDGRVAPGSSTK